MSKIKISKTAYCGYLYADGHAVIVHQERHAKAGSVQWVEIFERVECKCRFTGRIVFHQMHRNAQFKMAVSAAEVRASMADENNGSDNTRKLGLRVASFTIEFKDGSELYWVRVPDLLSDGLTYQPECNEVFNPAWGDGEYTWGISKIAMVHRLPKEKTA